MKLFGKKEKKVNKENTDIEIIEDDSDYTDPAEEDSSEDVSGSDVSEEDAPVPEVDDPDAEPEDVVSDPEPGDEPIDADSEDSDPEDAGSDEAVPDDAEPIDEEVSDEDDFDDDDDDEDSPKKAKKKLSKKSLIIIISVILILCAAGYVAVKYVLGNTLTQEPAVFTEYPLTDWESTTNELSDAAVRYLLYGKHTVTNPDATSSRDLIFGFYPTGEYKGYSLLKVNASGTWDITTQNGIRYLLITFDDGHTEDYNLALNTQTGLITLTGSAGIYTIHYLDAEALSDRVYNNVSSGTLPEEDAAEEVPEEVPSDPEVPDTFEDPEFDSIGTELIP